MHTTHRVTQEVGASPLVLVVPRTYLFHEMTFLLTPLSVKSRAEVAYSKRWFLTPCSSTRLSHTYPLRPYGRREVRKRKTAAYTTTSKAEGGIKRVRVRSQNWTNTDMENTRQRQNRRSMTHKD